MESTVRVFSTLLQDAFDDEGVPTVTSVEQQKTEGLVLAIYEAIDDELRAGMLRRERVQLRRAAHADFLDEMLRLCPQGYESLDASRPWLVYWVLHSMWLLGALPDKATLSKAVDFLSRCQHAGGGFGGGPGQFAHLATTYAAVNALAIIGTEEAYAIIDRPRLLDFLLSVRDADGSFALHAGGEQDIRGVYCALSVAKLTNVYTDKLIDGTAEWIVSCQTYEGGFGACPGMEAHGGYTFCGIAALALLNRSHLLDADAALRWCANRQMRVEGGFQGRTNKLVDGCYSFWQGGAFPILQLTLKKRGSQVQESCLFETSALREYILLCCQSKRGGLHDKPGKYRDAYHTCYTLSGLSVTQFACDADEHTNRVNDTHPVHNISPQAVGNIRMHFKTRPVSDKRDTS